MAAHRADRRLRDADIRRALVEVALRGHIDQPDTLIRHELGICAGARRVDVALVNGELSGWEIKSDEDTLRRLGGQAPAYGAVLDRATLVVTARWEHKAHSAVPEWWGLVIVAPEEAGRLSLRFARPPLDNSRSVDPFALAQLLWRDEAIGVLRSSGDARGLSGKARHYVWERLAATYALADLRAIVRRALKERPAWPGGR